MEYCDDHLVLHGGTQRVVVGHLPRDQDIHRTALEDIPARTRANGGGLCTCRRRVKVSGSSDHDVLKATKSLGKASHELGDQHRLHKLDLTAVAAALEASRRRGGSGLDGRARLGLLPGAEQVHEPVIQTVGDSVNGRVRTVDGDVALGQLEEDALLGIRDVDRLETSKDERVCVE